MQIRLQVTSCERSGSENSVASSKSFGSAVSVFIVEEGGGGLLLLVGSIIPPLAKKLWWI